MNKFLTSVAIAQDGNNGAASVTYTSDSREVTFVVDAAGKIRDFASIQYLAAVVGHLLFVHGMTTTTQVPDVAHIATKAEMLVQAAFMQLGAVAAEVSQEPELAKLKLRPGWNYNGWLTAPQPSEA